MAAGAEGFTVLTKTLVVILPDKTHARKNLKCKSSVAAVSSVLGYAAPVRVCSVLLALCAVFAACGRSGLWLTGTSAPAPHGWNGGLPADIPDNIWSWWVHPLAVNDVDVTWVGGIARDATVKITRVNADSSIETIALGQTEADEHNGPAIAYHPDHTDLVLFFSQHNTDNRVHYRRVDRESLALGVPEELQFSGLVTYAQVLVRGDRIVLLTRVASVSWCYRISEDFGSTWSEERALIDGNGRGLVYVLAKPVRSDPSQAQFAFYGHPTSSGFRDVLYGSIDLDTGVVGSGGGINLGDLDTEGGPGLRPVVPAGKPALETALHPSPGYVVRMLDVGELDGMPAIAYAEWTGTEAPNYRVILRDKAGGWSSAPWTLPTGVVFGYVPDIHYHGGAAFTRDDGVISSREEAGTWKVERWRWDTTLGDLVLAEELSATPKPVIRPYVPYHDGRADVVVHELDRYKGYTDYRAATRFLVP